MVRAEKVAASSVSDVRSKSNNDLLYMKILNRDFFFVRFWHPC